MIFVVFDFDVLLTTCRR